MKPPSDRLLDLRGAGTDLPARTQPRYGVHGWVIFTVATVLGIISSALAWQFTVSLGKPTTYWRSLVILNCSLLVPLGAFHARDHLAVAAFPIRAPGAVPCRARPPPVGRSLLAGTHRGDGSVQWWLMLSEGRSFDWWTEVLRSALQNFDWEMITYWAIVGLSHARPLLPRVARPRAARIAARDKLVEAQLKALQQQLHPHFLFNTLHAISALMHRDVEAADRTLMRLSDLLRMTLEHSGSRRCTLKSELEFLAKYLEIEQTRFADRLIVRFDIQPETLDGAGPEPDSAAAGRERDQARRRQEEPAPATSTSPRAAKATSSGSRCETTASGLSRGCADGAAEGHRRVDDPRAAAASVRRRLPIRVPSPDAGARGRRRRAMAHRPASSAARHAGRHRRQRP